MQSMLAKAIFLSGTVTVTDVTPSPECKYMKQLDIFPYEMRDADILASGDESMQGIEIKVVTITWE